MPDATTTEAPGLRERLRAQAADYTRKQATAAKDEATRRGLDLLKTTRRHQPTFVAAVALGITGLTYAHGHRLGAILAGIVVFEVGAPAAYFATYAIRAAAAQRARRVPDLPVRKAGRGARDVARQIAVATAASGLWLLALGVLGVGARSGAQTVALVVEILAACALTDIVCRRHWTHLWQRRAPQHPVGDDAPASAPEPATPEAPPVAVEDRRADVQSVLDNFKVDASVQGYTRGPAVTRYEVIPGPGVSVNDIVKLQNDLAYMFESPAVRVYAPVPNKRVVAVEVPNGTVDVVPYADAQAHIAADNRPLLVCLGKDLDNGFVVADLETDVHVLIAGATGTGKSVCLNHLLCSVIDRMPPVRVRVLLNDPKRVELVQFDGIPHLVAPVVTDPVQSGRALAWVLDEMDRRYDLLSSARVRNIRAYNEKAPSAGFEPLWYLLVVVDELADLMMVAKAMMARAKATGTDPDSDGDIENTVVRLGQLARAAGVHLVLATQRPSVNVVTGLIKANMPTRIAFATASATDSGVILDQAGAEKLLGRGDGLYAPKDSAPVRFQGAYVSDAEVDAIVEKAKQAGAPRYIPALMARLGAPARPAQSGPQSPTDVVLAIVAAHPGCSTADITASPLWAARGGSPSQPQLSRITQSLVDEGALTRRKESGKWIDYRVTGSSEEQ